MDDSIAEDLQEALERMQAVEAALEDIVGMGHEAAIVGGISSQIRALMQRLGLDVA